MLVFLLPVAVLLLLRPARALAEPGGPPGLSPMAYLPVLQRPEPIPTPTPYSCPTTSGEHFDDIPHNGPALDHPSEQHGDLNLALRGWGAVSAPLRLVTYGGPAPDPRAPQLPGLFVDGRVPAFTAAYQLHDWDWGCGTDGCPGPLLRQWPVTLLGMATIPGETIRIPTSTQDIYQGVYRALVLYASEQRITLAYTRDNTAAFGYVVHIEGVCVDPSLLQLYRRLDAAGRPTLPALRNEEKLGTAAGNSVAVAVRDTGSFMDPRSATDWWQGKPAPAGPLLPRTP